MPPQPPGPSEGRRLMRRVGATLFALLILIYWGIGLNFSFAYGLLNEAQAQQTVLNYLWEVPIIGIPVGIVIPLLLLRPIARDYDRMLAGQKLEDPGRSADRLLRFPRRMVWYFTPVSIAGYLIGNVQSYYVTQLPFDEFWKGIPLGFPLGLLISLAAYLVVVHYLDPVRRLFVLRHGYGPAPRPITSIYRKVVITSITIVALSLALLWLIAYAQGQTLLEEQLHERMQASLHDGIADGDIAGDSPRLRDTLAELPLGERGYAFLVDASGNVVTDHPRGARSLADEGWDAVQRGAVVGGTGQFTDRVREVRLVVFAQVPGSTEHAVVVTYRDDFASPLLDMSFAMLGATLLGMAIAALLALTGARAITKPIRELTQAMRRARDDGTGGDTVLVTDDEVGALAGSYDGMMRRLREKTRALEESLERLREVDALKTRFMNIASHELRTPMTPIRTELHILQTGKRGSLTPEQHRGLQMIARNVERLNRLIRDLLDASRMQAGQLKLMPSRADLPELVAGVVQTMQGEARSKGVALDAEAPEPLWVSADGDRVVQVLVNLVENAIQFTPEGGKVSIRAAVEGGEAVVAVRDTGEGIDPHLLSRLFQPFSQAEPGMPRTEGGTGLGLFICRGIIEGHGGRIWCESEGRGKGARFLFTLPLAAPLEPQAPGVDPLGGRQPAAGEPARAF